MSGLVDCPVCWALGGWSRETFRPMRQGDARDPREWVRCPYCRGQRKVEQWEVR